MIEVSERDCCVTFAVRVTPRASRGAIDGEHAGALKVRLTAPPAEDGANEALRKLLSSQLNVSLSSVVIMAGAKSRTKRVAILGVTKDQVATLASLGTGRKWRFAAMRFR